MSETDGNLHNGYSTQCDLERVKLVNLMTAGNIDYENLEINTNDSAISEIEDINYETNDCVNNPFENSWSTWGKEILCEVKSSIASDAGDRVNPHCFPKIIERLIIDIKLLPDKYLHRSIRLWSHTCF